MDTFASFLFVTKLLTALGCALMAGLFFTFSNCMMKALARLTPAEGMAAMQSINVTILNPLFLTIFMGTAAACALLVLAALLRWQSPGSATILVGGALYLIGTFLVTVVCNVPMNNALMAVAPDAPDSARFWAGYLTNWTAWNHVRTVTSLAATAAFILALVMAQRGQQ